MNDSQPRSKDPHRSADELGAKFACLMMEHKDSLSRYLFSLHPIADEVDDLLQETALTLWKKIDKYDQERAFLPWALRVAYFEVLRWRKHMRNRRFYLSEETVNSLSAAAETEHEFDELRQQALQDCLMRLTSLQLKVIRQRYENSGTLKDLADSLSISSHKIYHTLEDARRALVSCVEKKLQLCGNDPHN